MEQGEYPLVQRYLGEGGGFGGRAQSGASRFQEVEGNFQRSHSTQDLLVSVNQRARWKMWGPKGASIFFEGMKHFITYIMEVSEERREGLTNWS